MSPLDTRDLDPRLRAPTLTTHAVPDGLPRR